MKKIFALILAVVMCCSLAACGGDDTQNNGENVQQEQTDNKNDKEINIKKVNVVGAWMNVASTSHGMKMVLSEDGKGYVTLVEENEDLTWERIDDDTLSVTANGKELLFEIGASDGIVELIWKGTFSRYTMVSEADYNNMIEAVEITAENWQEYFEVKPYAEPRKDDFGDVTDVTIGAALVLKDKYADSFKAADGAVEAKMSGQYHCPITYNVATGELELGAAYTADELAQKNLYPSTEEYISTEKLSYYNENGIEFNGYGCYHDSFAVNGDIVTADNAYYETIEITRIQGTLYLDK